MGKARGNRVVGPVLKRMKRVRSGEAVMAAAVWPSALLRQAGNSAATPASGRSFWTPPVQ